jgi:tRNA threonylcarbamoyladenosine biosynthesis protein TsaB
MNTLGIETATERLGAALITADGRAFDRHIDSRSSHCELLVGFISELVGEAGITLNEISGIAISVGPGSFTGLRIGIGTGMGLAYGLGAETCGIDTLAALAWNTGREGALACPLLDAKRQEAYTAVYRIGSGLPEVIIEPAAVPVSRLAEVLAGLGEKVIMTGPAADSFRPLFEAADGLSLEFIEPERAKPSAAAIARLGIRVFESGGGHNPAELQPVYLRRSDAEYAKMKKSEFCE